MATQDTLGARILEARKAQGLSQRDLAKLMLGDGASAVQIKSLRESISKWENGRIRRPKNSHLLALERALKRDLAADDLPREHPERVDELRELHDRVTAIEDQMRETRADLEAAGPLLAALGRFLRAEERDAEGDDPSHRRATP